MKITQSLDIAFTFHKIRIVSKRKHYIIMNILSIFNSEGLPKLIHTGSLIYAVFVESMKLELAQLVQHTSVDEQPPMQNSNLQGWSSYESNTNI